MLRWACGSELLTHLRWSGLRLSTHVHTQVQIHVFLLLAGLLLITNALGFLLGDHFFVLRLQFLYHELSELVL